MSDTLPVLPVLSTIQQHITKTAEEGKSRDEMQSDSELSKDSYNGQKQNLIIKLKPPAIRNTKNEHFLSLKIYKYNEILFMPMLHKGFRMSRSSMFHTSYRPLEFVIVFLTLLIFPCFIFDETHGQTLFIIHLLVTLCILAIIIYYFIQSILVYNDKKDGDHKKMNSATFEYKEEEEIDYQLKSSLSIYHDSSMIEDYGDKNKIRQLTYIYAMEFNTFFDIRHGFRSRVQAKIAPPLSTIILIYSTLCTAILFTITSAIFQKGIYQLCADRDLLIEIGSELQAEIESGECLMRKIELLNIMSYIAMSICLALVLLKQISEKAQQEKNDVKKKVFEAFLNKKMLFHINTLVDDAVKRLLNRLLYKNMRKEIFIEITVTCLLVLWHAYYFEYFINCKKTGVQLLDIFGRIVSAFNCVFFLNLLQRLMRQYRYLWIVLRQFSKPLYTEHIDDVLSWWQLRRYYRGYELAAFSTVFNTIVAWLLFVVIFTVMYMAVLLVILPDLSWNADEHIMGLLVSYMVYAVLQMCHIAVQAYKESGKNATMLDREIIHCKRNYDGKIDLQLILQIKEDILQNTRPFIILGLGMTPTTINLLRGYFLATGGSLIFKLYFSQDEVTVDG